MNTDKGTLQKARHLVTNTRVMTLSVLCEDIPWSSPVYFVYYDGRFYFFSNENSRHIRFAQKKEIISASVFHDSERLDEIFGFQMSGVLEPVEKQIRYLAIVKQYVEKFNFLKKVFGPQIIENRRFFLEKFKSRLYAFRPGQVFLSDNSRSTGKRVELDLKSLDHPLS